MPRTANHEAGSGGRASKQAGVGVACGSGGVRRVARRGGVRSGAGEAWEGR